MHILNTALPVKARRSDAVFLSPLARVLLCAGAAALALLAAVPAWAAAPTSAPQVLLVLTNSESMDGNTSGAIMVGSGNLATANQSLYNSSSPTSFTVTTDFTPPLSNPGVGNLASYTVSCGGNKCDNGPSRLNLAKAAIAQVVNSYAATVNFGLYNYSTSSVGLYTTWVYYMSGDEGFTFTNTSSAGTVINPCYGYSSATSNIKSACTTFATRYGSSTLSSNKYMTYAASSDDAAINDVLYAPSGFNPMFLTYGTVTPSNPYSYYSLSTYNNNIGSYSVSYSKALNYSGGWSTTPTNAGYVPFTPEVMYAQRGFGYGGNQSYTTGHLVVPMGTDPTTSTAFTTALSAETNSTSSSEIKSVAGQSAIAGLMKGAKSYLSGLTKAACQSQYVVLLTDGLPTMDLSGKAWPPLGTTTANAYALTATFNSDGSFASSNSQAVTDAINNITALNAAGIKTYVIGLGAGVNSSSNPIAAQVLQAMAIAGGTSTFFPATNGAALTAAFNTIVYQIYTASAISAPIAPVSVAGGNSLEYTLTSVPTPIAGNVRAFPVSSSGTPSQTASWNAATLMTTSGRTAALSSTSTTNTVVPLTSLDAAAFSLTATTCVPNTSTIVSYTVNPAVSLNSCSYLAGRDPGYLLGSFSSQNSAKYVGPPSSGTLTQAYGSYITYARANSTRAPLLVFTDNDGFIYGVNASTGALNWGWTSRHLVAKLQAYSTFLTSGATNGGFAVVDAMDGGGAWGSYLVGSFQSGSEHFSLKLDSTGKPTTVVYDSVVASGTSPGDVASGTGNAPLRQPVLVAYAHNAAYALYVVNVGSSSTLYEVNVATGATTSATLPFQLSSAMYLNAASNQLWAGAANGTVWSGSPITGVASADVARLQQIATTVNPANGSTVKPVLYVGYTEENGIPYAYALNASELTVWGVTATGWAPLWASTTTGYLYMNGGFSQSSSVGTFQSTAVVSDLPLVINGALVVPAYVPGTGCSVGSGYYDFFKLSNGAFPSNLGLNYHGAAVTANIFLGTASGVPYTPSITLTASGLALNVGASGATGGAPVGTPGTPILSTAKLTSKPFSWLQR